MIEVIRRGSSARGSRVYIGRPSVLGNPFVMGVHGTRDEVVAQYHAWLRREWVKGGAVRMALEALADRVVAGEDISLECFCAPLACHGDVVARAVRGIVARRGC